MYDYHSHTSFSTDSKANMADMIDAAYQKGIKELAITDHFDPDYPDPEFPFTIEFEGYHKALDEAKDKNKDKIKIIKGLEIGIQKGSTLNKCREQALAYDYDFLIGSFHSAEGYEIDSDRFYKNRSIEDSYTAFYTCMLDILKQYKDYDVIGHFNIIDRYSGQIPVSTVYMDLVEEILKVIIYDGKGLEINTSSFRYGMGERTTPAKEIFRLYKDLGGEIVTIGSDAHRMKDLGYGFDIGTEMIKSTGLKYLATFDQRKVNFVRL